MQICQHCLNDNEMKDFVKYKFVNIVSNGNKG